MVFWGVAALGAYPGFAGAFDNYAGHSHLAATLLQTLFLIAVLIGVLAVPSSLPDARSATRRSVLALAFAAGAATGACFVLSSLLIGLVSSIAGAYPGALPGLVGRRPWPGVMWWNSGAVGAVIFALGVAVGLGVGLIAALGFGLNLTPLLHPHPVARPAPAARTPGRFRSVGRAAQAILTRVSRWRGILMSVSLALFVLERGVAAARAAAAGRGFIFPHHTGFGVGLAEGVIYILYPVGIVAGLWYGNKAGGRWRRGLVATIGEVGPRVVEMGGYLATLLVGYLVAAAFFAGCYASAFGEDNRGAFIDQATHKTPAYGEERIGDFIFLSATSMIGAGPSPIQPASPLTKTLFAFQILVDFAWTGGVLLTAVGQAMDSKRKQPGIVVTVGTGAGQPTTTFAHINVNATVSALTRGVVAPVPPRAPQPRRAPRGSRVFAVALIYAALFYLMRGIRR